MISYEDAISLIKGNISPLETEEVDVHCAAKRRLAENVSARIDSPPFDKAAMDGYAVRDEDVRRLPAELRQAGEVFAGQTPHFRIGPGFCARIATGAPVPDGADLVVMQEHTEKLADGRIVVKKLSGTNICKAGEDVHAGDAVLHAGQVLGHLHVGVAAAAGYSRLRVFRHPSIAILCTGEEVREPGGDVHEGYIYNANGPVLRSLLSPCGSLVNYLGIVGDSRDELKRAVSAGLNYDLLVITGGVSEGPYDLVLEVLKGEGVDIVFHRWKVKPGKPALFGRRGRSSVFGLPGNPLSVYLSFHLLLRPALSAMAGGYIKLPEFKTGRVTEDVHDKPARRSFKPCRIETRKGQNLVVPMPYNGSADIVSSSQADAYFTVPEGIETVRQDDLVDFFEVEV